MDMNSPLVIRQAAEGDLEAVLRLYAQPDIDNGEVLPHMDAREIFARFKRYPDYKLYVVVDGADVVGSFALLIMDNLGHLGAPSGLIEDVVVDPTRQGRGIGREMMAFAIERCRERGCYKVALSSNLKRERAHKFYDSIGFERHGYSFRVEL
jgi:GNAT superfamily N-acetyltransferase